MAIQEPITVPIGTGVFSISNDFKYFIAINLNDPSTPHLSQFDLEEGLTISLPPTPLQNESILLTPGDVSNLPKGQPQSLSASKSFTNLNIQLADDPITGEKRTYINLAGIGIFDVLLIDPVEIKYVQSSLLGPARALDGKIGEMESIFLQSDLVTSSLILTPNLLVSEGSVVQ